MVPEVVYNVENSSEVVYKVEGTSKILSGSMVVLVSEILK